MGCRTTTVLTVLGILETGASHMVRLPLLGLLALAPPVVAVASAQTASAPQASRRLGLLAGINLATFAGSNVQGASNHTGFLGGVVLVLPMAQDFALQIEGEFTMKGAESNSSNANSSFKLNYVELPVLARFDVPVSGGVKPFIYAGTAIALQTSCDIEATSGGVTVTFTCEEANRQFGSTTKFNSFDVGAMLGGGLAFDVNGRTLTVGTRYNWGLQHISSDADAKNRVLSFVLTFEWPIGGTR
jgi:opacity protein-like surface antigen